ncbi:type IV secretion system protein [Achromobacter xylosoxidans]
MTISLMWYGWLIASGAIQTPVLTALKRVVNIVIIVSIVGTGGLYQTEIVGALLKLPAELTSALSEKATDPATMFDKTASEGVTIGTKVTARAPNSLTSPVQAMAFVIVAHVIALISAALSAIGLILLVVAKSGMGMLAILGPLCLLALLSDYTRRFFDNWVSQVLYYGLYAAIFTTIFSIIIGMWNPSICPARHRRVQRRDQPLLDARGGRHFFDYRPVHGWSGKNHCISNRRQWWKRHPYQVPWRGWMKRRSTV